MVMESLASLSIHDVLLVKFAVSKYSNLFFIPSYAQLLGKKG